jgi:UDP-glucuronate 4-epimerase
VGADNLNSYYDVSLKQERLRILKAHENFRFYEIELAEKVEVNVLFRSESINCVLNLAAQPGVRYSITNPEVSIRNNINTFFNLLEGCREFDVNTLVYASSSSVYGYRNNVPFSVEDNVDHPISLYAATKKSNELMAYTYHHLYKLNTIGLRFFTVYGPYGRPDMAYYKFSQNIMSGKPIDIYNNGDMERDFTFIDDVVESIFRLLKKEYRNESRIFNIGGEHPVNLLYFIELLEKQLGKEAIKVFKEMQPGDVKITCADSSELAKYIEYKPETKIEDGLEKFVNWFKGFYKYDQSSDKKAVK